MKKLGIITFNRALNYGAVLQAYAMKRVCESLGYEVHVIDYHEGPETGPQPLQTFLRAHNKKKAVLPFLRNILSYHWKHRRWQKFRRFRGEYLDESVLCETSQQISKLGYSAYVIGSDQIWNYHITGGRFDPVYFGRLPKGAVYVVYGASAHDTPFPPNMEKCLKKELWKTDAAIGIREKRLKEYVGTLTGIDYPAVLDPTLLAGRAVMEEVTGSRIPRRPYILLYQIDTNPASDITIRSLEKKFGRRVYSMTVPKLGSLHGKKGSAGPEEFLALLSHADFLVTNSFHGVALSLLMHKQFYVYENGGVMTRIDDLLDLLDLEGRKVRLTADIDPDDRIDYAVVDEMLDKMRSASLAFLKKALQGESTVAAYIKKESPLQGMAQRKKEDCSGCAACTVVCPSGAISMKSDEEGFLYPEIDREKCIHCGICDTFCSFTPVPGRAEEDLPEAYGVKHKQRKTRRTSRSGGAFVAISDVILGRNGVIYGAAMEKDCSVRHIRAESAAQRDRMKGAKYVQSDVSGILNQVIEDLNSGRQVLFSGTPCQAAGLRALLAAKKIDSEKLFICDLVCHGAPSPGIWADYCDSIRKKYHADIVKADFRDKSFGWDSHFESFVLDNGKKVVSRDYTDLFYDHIMFRPACHHCRYANLSRVGDITLADFWGIEKNDPSFEDTLGVSLVLINSDKGKEVFQEAEKNLDFIQCDVMNCLQPTLVKPSIPSPRREMFWKEYRDKGFTFALNKYVRPVSTAKRIKRDLKKILFKMKLRPHP